MGAIRKRDVCSLQVTELNVRLHCECKIASTHFEERGVLNNVIRLMYAGRGVSHDAELTGVAGWRSRANLEPQKSGDPSATATLAASVMA